MVDLHGERAKLGSIVGVKLSPRSRGKWRAGITSKTRQKVTDRVIDRTMPPRPMQPR